MNILDTYSPQVKLREEIKEKFLERFRGVVIRNT